MSQELVLTAETVREITSGKTWGQDVRAHGYQRVDKDAASYIARCGGGRGDICDLSSLRVLDEITAQAIANFGGSLNLNSVTELSDRAAEILATQGSRVDLQWRGVALEAWSNITESAGHISLLKHIVRVAKKREHVVVLAGAGHLGVKAARALSKCSKLTIGVENLDAKTAKALAGVTFLNLPKLEVTEDVANAWSEGSRTLALGRYVEIDARTAAMLPNIIGPRGFIELPNVKELDAVVAEVLGRIKRLSFDSLTSISEEVVRGLVCHATKDSCLQFKGALLIDGPSAARLVDYPGSLRLNVELLAEPAAKILREKAGVPLSWRT